MAQQLRTDFSAVCDTVNCLKPTVDAGNMNAAQIVLDQLGIKYNSPLSTEEASLTWGLCRTSNNGLDITAAADAKDAVVPDVRGYGLRDALFRLERMGLKVVAHGVGRVTQQNMPAGYRFKKGETITLVLGDAKDVPEAERDTTATEPQEQPNANEPEDHELAPTAEQENAIKQQEEKRRQQMRQERAERAEQNRTRQNGNNQNSNAQTNKQPADEPRRRASGGANHG